MKIQTGSIVLAIILALLPSLPALAQESDSETITITLATKTVIEIELNPTDWPTGTIEPNQEYKTYPEKGYFTMTNKGNCDLHTYVKGNDVVWSDNPNYKWELSSDGNNGNQIYVLWYETSDWEASGGLITAEERDFCLSLGLGGSKHFGLKLKAPLADYENYFYGGGNMETTVTISGVVA